MDNTINKQQMINYKRNKVQYTLDNTDLGYQLTIEDVEKIDTNEVSINNFGDSMFDNKDKQRRVIGSNWYLSQKTDLYWIRHKNDTDIKTQGYVGIKPHGCFNRWRSEINQLIDNNYITKEEIHNLVFSVVATGTKSDISVEEIKLRSQMGIGWNYSVGGNCVNGVLGAKRAWMPWYLNAIKENPSLEVK